jgi:hypothetical protein
MYLELVFGKACRFELLACSERCKVWNTPELPVTGTKCFSMLPSTCQFLNLKYSFSKHMGQTSHYMIHHLNINHTCRIGVAQILPVDDILFWCASLCLFSSSSFCRHPYAHIFPYLVAFCSLGSNGLLFPLRSVLMVTLLRRTLRQ